MANSLHISSPPKCMIWWGEAEVIPPPKSFFSMRKQAFKLNWERVPALGGEGKNHNAHLDCNWRCNLGIGFHDWNLTLSTEDIISSQIGVDFCDQNIFLVLRIEAHEQDDETLSFFQNQCCFCGKHLSLGNFFFKKFKLQKYRRMISLRLFTIIAWIFLRIFQMLT
jgi:hypothetical protein